MPEPAGKVADTFETRIRELEKHSLSPLAVRSYETRGRARPEEPCLLRTPFQRDRDRVVHTKAFRRLAHKTQVFIDPEGDHYRTRLTHTLETTGISRGVAAALGLNVELTESIGLGHDLGHSPFGHAGEGALDKALAEKFGLGFRHNEHSLRVVDVLERDGRGLNLTAEVRDGILNHTGDNEPETLEGRIVRLVDRVAYINHDIDDAIRAGAVMASDLPREEITVLGDRGSRRIDRLVHDIVENSSEAGDICQSEEVSEAMLSLRRFMFERVYLSEHTKAQNELAILVVRTLFDHLLEHPEAIPENEGDLVERVTDYVAGMTDRFALALYENI
jgi:dGTPase